MSIRKPPVKLASPNILTLCAGAFLERVHDRSYSADSFNPCRGAPTRFAPVHDVKGNCVPSLYAGDTLESAIYETIFHDVPVTAKRKTVPKTLVQSRAHGRLQVLRDLRLASLRGPDLRRWRISRNALITTSSNRYRDTAQWAKAVHHAVTPAKTGVQWLSGAEEPAPDPVSSTGQALIRGRWIPACAGMTLWGMTLVFTGPYFHRNRRGPQAA